jgi:hypothetical protein
MSTRTAVVALLVRSVLASGATADWKPAAGPLTTRWGKGVSPDRVLAEYQRPQMRRASWKNLNGLWQVYLNGVLGAKVNG